MPLGIDVRRARDLTIQGTTEGGPLCAAALRRNEASRRLIWSRSGGVLNRFGSRILKLILKYSDVMFGERGPPRRLWATGCSLKPVWLTAGRPGAGRFAGALLSRTPSSIWRDPADPRIRWHRCEVGSCSTGGGTCSCRRTWRTSGGRRWSTAR